FDLDTSDSSKTKVRVAGTNISALLGSDADGVIGTADDIGARITNGRIGAVFYKGASGTTYALDASGTASLVGISGLTLSGSLAARINTTGGAVNETITMPSGSPVSVVFAANESAPVFSGTVTAEASGFASLSGAFSISKNNSQLTVGSSNVTAFVGAGTAGLRISNGGLGVVVDTTTKKYAAVASGAVSLAGVDALQFSGSASVRINTLGTSINQTISTPGGDVIVSFPTSANVLQASGTVSLGVSDFVDASATINVEKVTSGDVTTLLVQSSNVTAFFGTGASTASTSDDRGVRLTSGALDVRININTATEAVHYAFGARGTASLVGISGLTLTGTLHAERNTGPNPVTLDFGTASTADDLTLASGVTHFGGAAQLAIGGFVEISAAFDFNQSTSTNNGVSTTRITVAATDVQVFLGANGTGVRLTNGKIGAVIDIPEGGEAKYALVASGTAGGVGSPGLTLAGTMEARVNQLGAPIDTTITTPGGAVRVKFDSAAEVMEFGGSAELSILGFVSLSGSFGIKKEGDTLLVGVADVEAFLGMGGGTSSAIGLTVSNGNLGLVLQDGGYALTASGDVGLVGLTGLNISGTFDIRSNQLGQAVNRTIATPAGPVSVQFATGESVLSFGGSAVISVAGIFEISGTVKATKTNSDLILIDIPEITAALNINGLEVFEVGGRARFSIGGEDGFQLLDIGLKTVHVMGLDISAVAGMLPSLALPSDASIPAPAELTTIVDGIDAGVLNRRKYLDITLRSPGSLPLDVASVLDGGAEFVLSGSGVAEATISSVEHLEGNRFRYYFVDSNPSNDVPLFTSGPISVNFSAGAWADESGVTNSATTDSFTVRDGKATTGSSVNLGPLKLQGPHFGLEDFQFKPLKNADGSLLGARITITVALGVDHAELNFGGSSSVLSTSIDNLDGLFDVNVDISPSLSIIGGGLGKFRIDVGSMSLDVADVLKAEASGVTIQYNPERDTNNDGTVSSAEQAAYDSQEILRLQNASVTITKLGLTGSLGPWTRSDGTVIPGLVVRNNGFHLGTAQMQYSGDLSFGSILQLDSVTAGISDFGVNFNGGVEFDGEVFIASGGAALFPGRTFSMSFTDGPDANTEAVRAALTFEDGVPAGFKFNSDRMSMTFGQYLTVSGQDILIDTEASGSEYVVSIGSIEAEIKAGPLKLGGKMKNFGITGDGNFVTKPGFGVFISADTASGESFKWPSWLPIRPTELGIQWDDLQNSPERFSLIVSAA
ncbi:MAG: beta strand repeat-containing protein, partial [Planctomyces sp.]